MGLTRSAADAVRREARLLCLGYLGGYRDCTLRDPRTVYDEARTPGFVKFEMFQSYLSSFFEPVYVENVTLEDFTEWYREFQNAQPR